MQSPPTHWFDLFTSQAEVRDPQTHAALALQVSVRPVQGPAAPHMQVPAG